MHNQRIMSRSTWVAVGIIAVVVTYVAFMATMFWAVTDR